MGEMEETKMNQESVKWDIESLKEAIRTAKLSKEDKSRIQDKITDLENEFKDISGKK